MAGSRRYQHQEERATKYRAAGPRSPPDPLLGTSVRIASHPHPVVPVKRCGDQEVTRCPGAHVCRSTASCPSLRVGGWNCSIGRAGSRLASGSPADPSPWHPALPSSRPFRNEPCCMPCLNAGHNLNPQTNRQSLQRTIPAVRVLKRNHLGTGNPCFAISAH